MNKILGGVLASVLISSFVYLFASAAEKSQKTITLSEDKETLEEYKDGSGFVYSVFFLSTREDVNTKIWNKKLRKVQKIKQNFEDDGFFKDLKTIENVTQEQLMNKCKVAYKTKVKDEEYDIWNEVWSLCSVLQVKPSLIADLHKDDYEDKTYGKIGEEQLVSTNKLNDKFWKMQQERFLNEKENVEKWCGEAYFKKSADSEYPENQVYKYCSLEGFKK